MAKIDIIMGVYNGGSRVSKAIDSIINQTFEDFQLIICNDASTDNTFDVLEEYRKQDRRIKIINLDKNGGLANALNECLKVCDSEYIARMDDDDIARPTRLHTQVEFLDAHPEYAICGASRAMFSEDGIWGKDIVHGVRSMKDIFRGKSFAHPTTMIRRKALVKVGYYTVKDITKRAEDYDLWCKLYEEGYEGYNLPDILLDYFESKTNLGKHKIIHRINEYKLKVYWRKRLKLPYKYILFSFRSLILIFLPRRVWLWYHYKKFSGESK
jgi:glycosyltransferase EpsE